MISIKSEREIRIIRENARLLAEILEELTEQAAPGLSTAQLDRLAERMIRRAGGVPAFKGYRGYPKTLCASLNDEVVHGIPRDDRILQEGDLLSLDLGLYRRGFYADGATTVLIGPGSPRAARLLEVAQEALERGIAAACAGNHVSDISFAICSYVESQGYSVVRRYAGHGIGRQLHEDPEIPNFGLPGRGPRLRPGMVLCLEPMVKEDEGEVELLADGWTAVTPRGGLAAHFEEMVLVTAEGPEILTRGGARSRRAASFASAAR
ncbi:MAG: type I methionyl aminopeptidase [Candidatus Acetothermia bacterium]|jgi:methionyl aminopeptidase|nr:type I methionyl aminopeptidase [Candidatus Acetothermia bacterium]MDH7505532.1 type I methionyl aminopeptidase [Candidatus Acetothermia bacterium]